jgi:hypothetical protein
MTSATRKITVLPSSVKRHPLSPVGFLENRRRGVQRCELLAERFGGGREDARDPEWLGEVASYAQVDGFDSARL